MPSDNPATVAATDGSRRVVATEAGELFGEDEVSPDPMTSSKNVRTDYSSQMTEELPPTNGESPARSPVNGTNLDKVNGTNLTSGHVEEEEQPNLLFLRSSREENKPPLKENGVSPLNGHVREDVRPVSSPRRSFTRRSSVLAMEELLGVSMPVLEGGGFVRVVDYMGDDTAVVQAARVSYGRGTKRVSADRSLIRFLMRHRHTTPFEMCEIKFHLKLPIFVARQLVRHRTASINEHSARYSVVPEAFFIPEAEALAEQSTINRQGRGTPLPPEQAERFRTALRTGATEAFALYHEMLNEADSSGKRPRGDEPGVARELARTALPLSTFTEMYWKCDLHNLLHCISLRADAHAQREIRVYAEAMQKIVEQWVPLVAEAWRDYQRDGARLSRMERALVQRLVRGEKLEREGSGLSVREWSEFRTRFGIK